MLGPEQGYLRFIKNTRQIKQNKEKLRKLFLTLANISASVHSENILSFFILTSKWKMLILSCCPLFLHFMFLCAINSEYNLKFLSVKTVLAFLDQIKSEVVVSPGVVW